MIPIELNIFFMTIYMLESLIIIVQSSLIIVVLGREWVQFKRLSPVDIIIISLGICHFCLQWASILFDFCSFFDLNYILWCFSVTWEFTNTLIFWLTSLLAVFYCAKVSSFTHPKFLWLKWRILRLIPQLVLGSLMICCVSMIPSIFKNYFRVLLITMDYAPTNDTMIERLKVFPWNFFKFHQLAVLFIPFILFVASIVSLMTSLKQHSEQMRHYNAGHCNSNMRAHSTALKSLIIFVIFFTSYFLSVVIALSFSLFDKRPWFWIWEDVIYALVSIRSTLLMLSSPTVRKNLKVKCKVLETT